MKNVYLVQVDVSACTGSENAYLPYTAGVLAASAWQRDRIKENYCFKDFIFLREDVEKTARQMEEPYLVGFSNYCWNTEYNKRLAIEIKKLWKNCIIVFGGHNVPENTDFLEKFPYIDILNFGEGEQTFADLLEGLLDKEPKDIPSIAYRDENGLSKMNTKTQPPSSLDFPSPYLDGWFDGIIKDHPEITFNAILETSRGCPNKCAYCDWGLLKSKTRLIPMERVLGEIEWMSKNKIAFVWGADGNFGMFERDLEIADALVKAKQTTGYPERMRMNYAKNNFERVYSIIEKFKVCEFDRIGATLSFQSLSDDVLNAIGRKNMSLDYYKNLLTKYNKRGMKAYSELILGLPNETYRSFIEGIGKLFEIGQHYVFEIYGCILLPNSIMGQKEFVEKYGIKTVRSEILRPHFSAEAFDVPEYNEIIVETNTMSRSEWVRATAFYYLTRAFHGSGLLRVFAVYLHNEKGINYADFYNGIMDFFEENPGLFTSKLYSDMITHADEISRGVNNRKLIFEPYGTAVWEDHEYLTLVLLSNIDKFYSDVAEYLKRFEYDDGVFDDLMKYQRSILRRPNEESAKINLHHDIHSFMQSVYINENKPLEQKEMTVTLTDTDVKSDWKTFAKEVIWYGKMGWKSYKDKVEW